MATAKKRTKATPATTATRSDPVLSMRTPAAFIKRIDVWAKKRGLSRNAAIRQLIEIALGKR